MGRHRKRSIWLMSDARASQALKAAGSVLGKRNPSTLGEPHVEDRQESYWRRVKQWANRPGGKY